MMKQMKKASYPYFLLAAGMPLLILGGCASTDVSKPNDESIAAVTLVEQPQAVTPVEENSNPEAVEQVTEAVAEVESEVLPSTDEALFPTASIISEPEERIIGFGFDKSGVDTMYQELLKQHAQYLNENSDMVLHIDGHTDSSGDKTYNKFLSKKRADEVAKLLVEYGAPEDRIKVSGSADDEPLISATHHREHRRVELNYQDQRLVSK